MADLKDLTKDILASYEARIRNVQEIAENTHQLTEGFKGQRENMSKELKEVLAKSQSLRKKDFNEMMKGILLAQSEREQKVKEMLADFRKEQTETAERLRNLLKKGEDLRLTDFKKTLAGIKANQIKEKAENPAKQIRTELAQMREGIYKMLEKLKTEIKK